MIMKRVFRRKQQLQRLPAETSERGFRLRFDDDSCDLTLEKRNPKTSQHGLSLTKADTLVPRKSSLKSKASWVGECSGREGSSSSLEFTVCEHSVEFDKVEIREYEPILGDQPCSEGPPITISWNCHRRKVLNVDKYERIRRGLRRHGDELKVEADVRRTYLLKNKFTVQEIHEAEVECLKIQQRRMATVRTRNPQASKHR